MFHNVFSLFFLAAVVPACAGTYLTTLHLASPVANHASADRIEYVWSTPLETGIVSAASLTKLTMRLFQGDALVYTDIVLAGGVLQPFGGVDRVAADVIWDYDLDSRTLLQMGSLQVSNPAPASGTHFYVTDNVTLPADAIVVIQKIHDGIRHPFTVDTLTGQQSNAVPEPGAGLLAGLALATLGALRRRAG
ncbi:MAG: hypothetical protein JNM66_20020 [Bryobacterales bacterium]|nr:hypothetical protein [Bryobacterales bacterium]